jgi:acyl-CoA synthetase (AMP-forming)/AMP-acid ligase II
VLNVLPFFHIYGFNGILNPSIFYGMHMVTIPKFTPEDYIACVAKFKVTKITIIIHLYFNSCGLSLAITSNTRSVLRKQQQQQQQQHNNNNNIQ